MLHVLKWPRMAIISAGENGDFALHVYACFCERVFVRMRKLVRWAGEHSLLSLANNAEHKAPHNRHTQAIFSDNCLDRKTCNYSLGTTPTQLPLASTQNELTVIWISQYVCFSKVLICPHSIRKFQGLCKLVPVLLCNQVKRCFIIWQKPWADPDTRQWGLKLYDTTQATLTVSCPASDTPCCPAEFWEAGLHTTVCWGPPGELWSLHSSQWIP